MTTLISSILGAACNSREAYNLVADAAEEFVGGLDGVPELVYKEIAKYYDTDRAATRCDIGVIRARLHRIMGKHSDAADAMLDTMPTVVSPNVLQEILEFRRQRLSRDLSVALVSGSPEISDLIKAYQEVSAEVDGTTDDTEEAGVYRGASVASVAQHLKGDSLLPLYPEELNERLGGGVPRGTNILIFALPEVGKSMIAVNMTSVLCEQGKKVLVCGNEDPAPNMLMRFISRFSGMTKAEIVLHPDDAEYRASENGYDNLIYASLHPGSLYDIERLVRKYSPDVVVIDQLRHLRVQGSKGETEVLSKVGQGLRNLGKKYNIVTIGIHQAAASAQNKLVLDIGDMYMSNISLPGDADVLVGVGSNVEYDSKDQRMLTIVKNKLTGDHGYFPVKVNRALSLVE